ncbi:20760_t:CDS:2, partial [Cetraspora pellucida]
MRISDINDWFKVAFEQAYIKFFDYNSFDTKKVIGKGGFGTVFSAYSSDTEKTVALKSLYAEGSIDEGFVREVSKTLQRLTIMIISYGFLELLKPKTGTYYMVLQFANDGDLRCYLHNHFSQLDWQTKIRMAKEIS